jgi:hypothetical protein
LCLLGQQIVVAQGAKSRRVEAEKNFPKNLRRCALTQIEWDTSYVNVIFRKSRREFFEAVSRLCFAVLMQYMCGLTIFIMESQHGSEEAKEMCEIEEDLSRLSSPDRGADVAFLDGGGGADSQSLAGADETGRGFPAASSARPSATGSPYLA